MANYADPDKFFDESQIEYGVGTGKESIRANLKSTNGAAYRAESAVADVRAVVGDIRTVQDATKAVLEQRWKWENQPESGEGTNNIFEATKATNGQVYRTAAEVTALRTELAELKALVVKALDPKASK